MPFRQDNERAIGLSVVFGSDFSRKFDLIVSDAFARARSYILTKLLGGYR